MAISYKKDTLGSMPWNSQISLCHSLPFMSPDFSMWVFRTCDYRTHMNLYIHGFDRWHPGPSSWEALLLHSPLLLVPVLKGSHLCFLQEKGRKYLIWIVDLRSLPLSTFMIWYFHGWSYWTCSSWSQCIPRLPRSPFMDSGHLLTCGRRTWSRWLLSNEGHENHGSPKYGPWARCGPQRPFI